MCSGAELAERLQVARCWIDRRIRNGTITISRDDTEKRFLFPDTPKTLAALQALKSGQSSHLEIVSHPDE